MRTLRTIASLVVQVAVLVALVAAFLIRAPQVSGLSMEPNIDSDEYVLINIGAYRLHPPQRNDIIAFHHDGMTPEVYIKRIVGIPGDRVRVERGEVVVNGKPIDEPYVHYPDGRSFAQVTVPAGSLYVLGDNRGVSDDSRFWGFVRDDQILGKALAGVWPLNRFGVI
ncbi:MAG TPA: signal peptidase I [Verrucomicrobiae bacterium]|nr:signal peptidase I [Verrucomicrobiae bacterium]